VRRLPRARGAQLRKMSTARIVHAVWLVLQTGVQMAMLVVGFVPFALTYTSAVTNGTNSLVMRLIGREGTMRMLWLLMHGVPRGLRAKVMSQAAKAKAEVLHPPPGLVCFGALYSFLRTGR